MPNHHLTDSWLLEYAAGATAEAHGLFVATHLALCPPCRDKVRGYEALGGALLDQLPPTPLAAGRIESALKALDGQEPRPRAAPSPVAVTPEKGRLRPEQVFTRPLSPSLPSPLRGYVRAELNQLPWRRVKSGLAESVLPLPEKGPHTRLMLLQAGASIPRHAHRGVEGVLILTGGLSDGKQHLRRGDTMLSDESVEHENIADTEEDCLALIVSDGSIRLTGALGGLLNLFGRF
jgi:putative transcriptional regulator